MSLEEIKKQSRWVCVKSDSKVPFQPDGTPASTSKPETWHTYEECVGAMDQVGLVFTGDGLVGIDLDDGYDEYGLLTSIAVDCMRACKSYTEKSRSGRGIHILLYGNLPFKGKNNRKGAEIYSTGRYFITTEKTLIFDTVESNQDAIDYVVSKYFQDELREISTAISKTPRIYNLRFEKPKANSIKIKPIYPEITSGSRNLSLTSLAGQLYTQGRSKAEIYLELLKCNQVACKPPLEQREIESIVNSIARYRR